MSVEYISNVSQLKNFQTDLISSTTYYGLDTETTSLDSFTSTWLLLQIKLKENIYVFDVRELGIKLITYIIDLLNNSSKIAIGHNIKFDLKIIKVNTGTLINLVADTQINELLITNGIATGKARYPSYADVVYKYIGKILDKSVRDTFIDYNGPITQQQINYAADDVLYLEDIHSWQHTKLMEQGQDKVYNLECALIPVVAKMELNGIKLDEKAWMINYDEADKECKRIEKELKEEIVSYVLQTYKFANALEASKTFLIYGAKKLSKKTTETLEGISAEFITTYLQENINIGSPDQLLNILTKFYNVPIDSTNEKVINKFQTKYPIIAKILKFREYKKKLSSFGQSFIDLIHPVTLRIHPNYNQLGAQSGRFSSSDPNMFNIPKNNQYRNCFISEPGYKIIGMDFSQEELRLMAASSGDPNMIKAFLEDVDLHTRTAALVFGKEDKDVTPEERYKGKTINFTVGYDGTEYALYKNFDIPMDEGRKLISDFYSKAYPTLRAIKDALGNRILELGYAKTPLGRKRFFVQPVLYADLYEKRREEEKMKREGGNHVLGQGPGADIIKAALVRIHNENQFGENNLKIITQVYDEIVCEVKEEYVENVIKFMEKIMLEEEQKFLKNVPAKVEYLVGDCWLK